jgi:hypothetical protein
VGESEHGLAAGGQLHRQWQAVDEPADVRHDVPRRTGRVEPVAQQRGAVAEQRHLIVLGQRPDLQHLFARHTEPAAGGRQDPQLRAARQELVDQRTRRTEHMLAGVQHEQRPFTGEPVGDRGLRAGGRRLQAQRRRHRGRHVRRRRDGAEVHGEHLPPGQLVQKLLDHAGLADAAGPDHADRAVPLQRAAQPRQLDGAAHEAVRGRVPPWVGGHGPGPRRPRSQSGVVREESPFHVGQGGTGIHAGLVDQPVPVAPAHRQRVGGATGQVQGPHAQQAQPFAQRMRRGRAFEVGQGACRLPGVEQQREPLLGHRQPPLRQPRQLRGERQPVRHVGERFAAPQVECSAQQHRRLGGVGRRDPPPLGDELLRPADVDVAAVQAQPVAAGLVDHPAGTDDAAQRRDVAVEVARRVRRRFARPEHGDQLGDRDHLVGREGEPGGQPAVVRPGARRRRRRRAPGPVRAAGPAPSHPPQRAKSRILRLAGRGDVGACDGRYGLDARAVARPRPRGGERRGEPVVDAARPR